jgi:hypothetical protein
MLNPSRPGWPDVIKLVQCTELNITACVFFNCIILRKKQQQLQSKDQSMPSKVI